MNRALFGWLLALATPCFVACSPGATDDAASADEADVTSTSSKASAALIALVAKADKIVLSRGAGTTPALDAMFGAEESVEIGGDDVLAAAGALGLDAGTKVDVSERPITSRCPPPLRVTIHRDGEEALAISYLCVANRLESVVYLKDGTLVTSADGASEGLFLLGSPQRLARLVKKEPIRMRDAIDPVETVSLVGEDGEKTLDVTSVYYAPGSKGDGDSREVALGAASRCLSAAELLFRGKSALSPKLTPEVVRVRICDTFSEANVVSPSGQVVGLLSKLSDPKALKAAIEAAE